MNPPNVTPETPSPDTLIRVGRIFRPHGVRGELKVDPETEDPARFESMEVLYIGLRNTETQSHPVEAIRYQETKRGTTVILKLEGVDTREEAEAFKKKLVFATEDDLPPLEEGEFFVHDLIGLAVVTEAGEPVGTVANVLQMPAHDVYVVRREGKPEAMIPAVADFIIDIDLDGERIVVRPIEGLLD